MSDKPIPQPAGPGSPSDGVHALRARRTRAIFNKPIPQPAGPGSPSDGAHALRASMKRALRNVEDLCAFVGLDARAAPDTLSQARQFSLLVTREFASRMEAGNWHDPLLRQVLPLAREYTGTSGGTLVQTGQDKRDAVGDLPATLTPGLIRKYRGRALIISHGGCAIHCRYCFRRHFPYSSHNAGDGRWEKLLAALSADRDIHEIILSGGDPLMHTDETIARQVKDLAQIPHLHTVRVHTRVPVLCPKRVGDTLLSALTDTRLRPVVVLHINHAREIDEELGRVSRRLSEIACVLNQSVLLAGVNDSATAMTELSRALFDASIMPYYLHLLDEVGGVGHFRVPLRHARHIHRKMQENLPGYLVPRLVREQAGAAHKLWVNSTGTSG